MGFHFFLFENALAQLVPNMGKHSGKREAVPVPQGRQFPYHIWGYFLPVGWRGNWLSGWYRNCISFLLLAAASQEDVNGEKLTVKKNGGFLVPIFSRFGADFFMVYADFSRFYKGHER